MRSQTANPPALAERLRSAISKQPDRFNQQRWLGNYWLEDPWIQGHASVDLLREILSSPVPSFYPSEPDLLWGTTACVGGFAAVFAAPPRSVFSFVRQTVMLSGGGTYTIREYAARKLNLSKLDGDHYLFLPQRTTEEVDVALSIIARGIQGRWRGEPLWSLVHANLGRPVAERPQF